LEKASRPRRRFGERESPAPRHRRTDIPSTPFINAKIEAALASSAAASGGLEALSRKTSCPSSRRSASAATATKNQGGLKLNSREAALRGGDSEIPAIVPGDPATPAN
jgi:hypothetical protein